MFSVSEQLINVNNLSLNYNLREPNGNRATNVYAVLRIGHIQLKLSTMCKVNSWQWDKKKQIPLISGNITKTDYTNNLKIISLLSKIRLEVLNYFSYLCTSSETNSVKELVDSIRKIIITIIKVEDMNDENLNKSVLRTPKASTLLVKAFDLYYSTYRITVKEVSKSREKGKIDAFISYLEEKGGEKQ